MSVTSDSQEMMPNMSVMREIKHRRRVVSDGYLRSDELWEVEARMQDIKA